MSGFAVFVAGWFVVSIVTAFVLSGLMGRPRKTGNRT